MPYKNPDKQREAKRVNARLRRASLHGTRVAPVEPIIPTPLRLRTALDALELITEQVNAARADATLGTAERARVVGYLASIALRAVEQADLAARVEAIERALGARGKPAGSAPACVPAEGKL